MKIKGIGFFFKKLLIVSMGRLDKTEERIIKWEVRFKEIEKNTT